MLGMERRLRHADVASPAGPAPTMTTSTASIEILKQGLRILEINLLNIYIIELWLLNFMHLYKSMNVIFSLKLYPAMEGFFFFYLSA
jgi:hypothetical protein